MKYDGKNLKEVLKAHELWLMSDTLRLNNGQDDSISRADLSNADLREVNLRGADLSGADLSGADLSGANLREAYLRGANLSNANLSNADLREANLREAYLREADLISNTDLRGADLRGADLRGADLREANLREAYLRGADLRGTKNIPYIPMACPDSGSFIGWKVCNVDNGKVIVKLLIPEDAKRSSGTGRKCRCDRAVVLEIQTMEGESLDWIKAYSNYDESFIYEVGKIVTPTIPFCEERFDECSSGIHFFINRQEAVDYST